MSSSKNSSKNKVSKEITKNIFTKKEHKEIIEKSEQIVKEYQKLYRDYEIKNQAVEVTKEMCKLDLQAIEANDCLLKAFHKLNLSRAAVISSRLNQLNQI